MEEAQEKIKELESRLEAVLNDFHGSETERAQLLSQVASANKKLNESEGHSQQLELELKNLQNEFESKNTLQLQTFKKTQEKHHAMQNELLDVKKAFDETLHNLVTSKMKTEELELDLSSAISKAKKYEELCREKDSHLEVQSKKSLEYEILIEDSSLRTKEMEDKIAILQKELKDLHGKTADDLQVKEHTSASSDFQKVQEELIISKSQVKELEQKITSGEATREKLTQELSSCKTSEEHARKDFIALENLLSVSKQELQIKIANLQEVESKYEREVKINEGIESTLRNQHKQVKNLQEKLVKVTGEKEALESVSAELNASLVNAKEACELLENKLNESDQKFCEVNSLLTQTRSYNIEIEQKLKALEELHRDSVVAAETANQRKLELEDLLKSSNATEELKPLLRETELKLLSAEQRNLELEQQLHFTELKCKDGEQELNEVKEKASELSMLLKRSEEQNDLSSCHVQASEGRANQLEASLNNSSKRILELEQELMDLTEKCTEHENQAGASLQRSLELEDSIQQSYSKSKDAEIKVAELETLLEATKYRVRELEEQLSVGVVKYRDAEEELVKFQAKVSELKEGVEASQVRSESLEMALQTATDKEKELTSQLNIIMEEKNKFEQSLQASSQQHMEAENLLKVLQLELKLAKEKLEAVEKDLGVSNVREQELLKKLRYTEEQLEHSERKLENSSARSLELETLHATLAKDLELKLQETLLSLSQKDFEAKQLTMQLQSIEGEATSYQTEVAEATERATFYQNLAGEATEKAASLKAELEGSCAVRLSLEESIADLKTKIQEAEMKAEQTLSEYEIMVNTNSKLKEEVVAYAANVIKLQEMVNSVTVEKDKTTEQLASHAKTISEITDEHSRELDSHLETKSHAKETEKKLLDAIEQIKIRDSECKILNDNLLSLESQATIYEKQASEATCVAENRKIELDEALLKVKKNEEIVSEFQRKSSLFEIENESLATTNLKLSHDLGSYETKLNQLQKALDSVLSDKDEIVGQLNTSKKTIEDLSQELAVERERLQSQISSVMEEKHMFSELHQNTKEELQGIISKLEGQLDEQKAKESALNEHIKYLKADLLVKSEMEARISELEQHLVLVDNQFKEEINDVKQASTAKELLLASKLEEASPKLKERDDLSAQLAQLQTELYHARTIIEQKERTLEADAEHDVENKSRDFSLGMTKPLRRKNTKRRESSRQLAETSATIEEHSLGATIKFILGVALVSMVIGVILGKQY